MRPDVVPMRVLLYADLRTSHALGWLAGLEASGIVVRAVSSELDGVQPDRTVRDPFAHVRNFAVSTGLNKRLRSRVNTRPQPDWEPHRRLDALQVIETLTQPIRLPFHIRSLRRAAQDFRPDVVHALRLPYEGIRLLSSGIDAPLVVSSWGQDFQLQARQDPILANWLRRTLPRANGLHVDTKRDEQNAADYGFKLGLPVLHAAGNFGVDRDLFFPQPLPPRLRLVVYPRGRRSYVNHRLFLGLAQAFATHPTARFLGIGLRGDPEADALADQLGPSKLTLTDELDRESFAMLLRRASVVVSPATSDGTPNSIIEALSVGAYVIAGAIPSVTDLLGPIHHSALIDPLDLPAWIAQLRIVLDQGLDSRAHLINPRLIPAEYRRSANQMRVPSFYRAVTRCVVKK